MGGSARLGGCNPVERGDGSNSLNNWLADLRETSVDEARAIAVPLFAVLSSAKTSDSALYKVPSTGDFLITGIRGHLALIDPLNEVLSVLGGAGLGLGALSMVDRMLMKAMNTDLELENQDNRFKVIENQKLALSDILQVTGGRRLDFGATPHKIPAGHTLTLNVSLTNTDTQVIGGSTEYGIVLEGVLVRSVKS